jgi:hypothetical protein
MAPSNAVRDDHFATVQGLQHQRPKLLPSFSSLCFNRNGKTPQQRIGEHNPVPLFWPFCEAGNLQSSWRKPVPVGRRWKPC